MRKYNANITLKFEDRKYSIVGESDTTRKTMIEHIVNFAKKKNLTSDIKSKKFFDKDGKEVGYFTLTSIEI